MPTPLESLRELFQGNSLTAEEGDALLEGEAQAAINRLLEVLRQNKPGAKSLTSSRVPPPSQASPSSLQAISKRTFLDTFREALATSGKFPQLAKISELMSVLKSPVLSAEWLSDSHEATGTFRFTFEKLESFFRSLMEKPGVEHVIADRTTMNSIILAYEAAKDELRQAKELVSAGSSARAEGHLDLYRGLSRALANFKHQKARLDAYLNGLLFIADMQCLFRCDFHQGGVISGILSQGSQGICRALGFHKQLAVQQASSAAATDVIVSPLYNPLEQVSMQTPVVSAVVGTQYLNPLGLAHLKSESLKMFYEKASQVLKELDDLESAIFNPSGWARFSSGFKLLPIQEQLVRQELDCYRRSIVWFLYLCVYEMSQRIEIADLPAVECRDSVVEYCSDTAYKYYAEMTRAGKWPGYKVEPLHKVGVWHNPVAGDPYVIPIRRDLTAETHQFFQRAVGDFLMNGERFGFTQASLLKISASSSKSSFPTDFSGQIAAELGSFDKLQEKQTSIRDFLNCPAWRFLRHFVNDGLLYTNTQLRLLLLTELGFETGLLSKGGQPVFILEAMLDQLKQQFSQANQNVSFFAGSDFNQFKTEYVGHIEKIAETVRVCKLEAATEMINRVNQDFRKFWQSSSQLKSQQVLREFTRIMELLTCVQSLGVPDILNRLDLYGALLGELVNETFIRSNELIRKVDERVALAASLFASLNKASHSQNSGVFQRIAKLTELMQSLLSLCKVDADFSPYGGEHSVERYNQLMQEMSLLFVIPGSSDDRLKRTKEFFGKIASKYIAPNVLEEFGIKSDSDDPAIMLEHLRRRYVDHDRAAMLIAASTGAGDTALSTLITNRINATDKGVTKTRSFFVDYIDCTSKELSEVEQNQDVVPRPSELYAEPAAPNASRHHSAISLSHSSVSYHANIAKLYVLLTAHTTDGPYYREILHGTTEYPLCLMASIPGANDSNGQFSLNVNLPEAGVVYLVIDTAPVIHYKIRGRDGEIHQGKIEQRQLPRVSFAELSNDNLQPWLAIKDDILSVTTANGHTLRDEGLFSSAAQYARRWISYHLNKGFERIKTTHDVSALPPFEPELVMQLVQQDEVKVRYAQASFTRLVLQRRLRSKVARYSDLKYSNNSLSHLDWLFQHCLTLGCCVQLNDALPGAEAFTFQAYVDNTLRRTIQEEYEQRRCYLVDCEGVGIDFQLIELACRYGSEDLINYMHQCVMRDFYSFVVEPEGDLKAKNIQIANYIRYVQIAIRDRREMDIDRNSFSLFDSVVLRGKQRIAELLRVGAVELRSLLDQDIATIRTAVSAADCPAVLELLSRFNQSNGFLFELCGELWQDVDEVISQHFPNEQQPPIAIVARTMPVSAAEQDAEDWGELQNYLDSELNIQPAPIPQEQRLPLVVNGGGEGPPSAPAMATLKAAADSEVPVQSQPFQYLSHYQASLRFVADAESVLQEQVPRTFTDGAVQPVSGNDRPADKRCFDGAYLYRGVDQITVVPTDLNSDIFKLFFDMIMAFYLQRGKFFPASLKGMLSHMLYEDVSPPTQQAGCAWWGCQRYKDIYSESVVFDRMATKYLGKYTIQIECFEPLRGALVNPGENVDPLLPALANVFGTFLKGVGTADQERLEDCLAMLTTLFAQSINVALTGSQIKQTLNKLLQVSANFVQTATTYINKLFQTNPLTARKVGTAKTRLVQLQQDVQSFIDAIKFLELVLSEKPQSSLLAVADVFDHSFFSFLVIDRVATKIKTYLFGTAVFDRILTGLERIHCCLSQERIPLATGHLKALAIIMKFMGESADSTVTAEDRSYLATFQEFHHNYSKLLAALARGLSFDDAMTEQRSQKQPVLDNHDSTASCIRAKMLVPAVHQIVASGFCGKGLDVIRSLYQSLCLNLAEQPEVSGRIFSQLCRLADLGSPESRVETIRGQIALSNFKDALQVFLESCNTDCYPLPVIVDMKANIRRQLKVVVNAALGQGEAGAGAEGLLRLTLEHFNDFVHVIKGAADEEGQKEFDFSLQLLSLRALEFVERFIENILVHLLRPEVKLDDVNEILRNIQRLKALAQSRHHPVTDLRFAMLDSRVAYHLARIGCHHNGSPFVSAYDSKNPWQPTRSLDFKRLPQDVAVHSVFGSVVTPLLAAKTSKQFREEAKTVIATFSFSERYRHGLMGFLQKALDLYTSSLEMEERDYCSALSLFMIVRSPGEPDRLVDNSEECVRRYEEAYRGQLHAVFDLQLVENWFLLMKAWYCLLLNSGESLDCRLMQVFELIGPRYDDELQLVQQDLLTRLFNREDDASQGFLSLVRSAGLWLYVSVEKSLQPLKTQGLLTPFMRDIAEVYLAILKGCLRFANERLSYLMTVYGSTDIMKGFCDFLASQAVGELSVLSIVDSLEQLFKTGALLSPADLAIIAHENMAKNLLARLMTLFIDSLSPREDIPLLMVASSVKADRITISTRLFHIQRKIAFLQQLQSYAHQEQILPEQIDSLCQLLSVDASDTAITVQSLKDLLASRVRELALTDADKAFLQGQQIDSNGQGLLQVLLEAIQAMHSGVIEEYPLYRLRLLAIITELQEAERNPRNHYRLPHWQERFSSHGFVAAMITLLYPEEESLRIIERFTLLLGTENSKPDYRQMRFLLGGCVVRLERKLLSAVISPVVKNLESIKSQGYSDHAVNQYQLLIEQVRAQHPVLYSLIRNHDKALASLLSPGHDGVVSSSFDQKLADIIEELETFQETCPVRMREVQDAAFNTAGVDRAAIIRLSGVFNIDHSSPVYKDFVAARLRGLPFDRCLGPEHDAEYIGLLKKGIGQLTPDLSACLLIGGDESVISFIRALVMSYYHHDAFIRAVPIDTLQLCYQLARQINQHLPGSHAVNITEKFIRLLNRQINALATSLGDKYPGSATVDAQQTLMSLKQLFALLKKVILDFCRSHHVEIDENLTHLTTNASINNIVVAYQSLYVSVRQTLLSATVSVPFAQYLNPQGQGLGVYRGQSFYSLETGDIQTGFVKFLKAWMRLQQSVEALDVIVADRSSDSSDEECRSVKDEMTRADPELCQHIQTACILPVRYALNGVSSGNGDHLELAWDFLQTFLAQAAEVDRETPLAQLFKSADDGRKRLLQKRKTLDTTNLQATQQEIEALDSELENAIAKTSREIAENCIFRLFQRGYDFTAFLQLVEPALNQIIVSLSPPISCYFSKKQLCVFGEILGLCRKMAFVKVVAEFHLEDSRGELTASVLELETPQNKELVQAVTSRVAFSRQTQQELQKILGNLTGRFHSRERSRQKIAELYQVWKSLEALAQELCSHITSASPLSVTRYFARIKQIAQDAQKQADAVYVMREIPQNLQDLEVAVAAFNEILKALEAQGASLCSLIQHAQQIRGFVEDDELVENFLVKLAQLDNQVYQDESIISNDVRQQDRARVLLSIVANPKFRPGLISLPTQNSHALYRKILELLPQFFSKMCLQITQEQASDRYRFVLKLTQLIQFLRDSASKKPVMLQELERILPSSQLETPVITLESSPNARADVQLTLAPVSKLATQVVASAILHPDIEAALKTYRAVLLQMFTDAQQILLNAMSVPLGALPQVDLNICIARLMTDACLVELTSKINSIHTDCLKGDKAQYTTSFAQSFKQALKSSLLPHLKACVKALALDDGQETRFIDEIVKTLGVKCDTLVSSTLHAKTKDLRKLLLPVCQPILQEGLLKIGSLSAKLKPIDDLVWDQYLSAGNERELISAIVSLPESTSSYQEQGNDCVALALVVIAQRFQGYLAAVTYDLNQQLQESGSLAALSDSSDRWRFHREDKRKEGMALYYLALLCKELSVVMGYFSTQHPNLCQSIMNVSSDGSKRMSLWYLLKPRMAQYLDILEGHFLCCLERRKEEPVLNNETPRQLEIKSSQLGDGGTVLQRRLAVLAAQSGVDPVDQETMKCISEANEACLISNPYADFPRVMFQELMEYKSWVDSTPSFDEELQIITRLQADNLLPEDSILNEEGFIQKLRLLVTNMVKASQCLQQRRSALVSRGLEASSQEERARQAIDHCRQDPVSFFVLGAEHQAHPAQEIKKLQQRSVIEFLKQQLTTHFESDSVEASNVKAFIVTFINPLEKIQWYGLAIRLLKQRLHQYRIHVSHDHTLKQLEGLLAELEPLVAAENLGLHRQCRTLVQTSAEVYQLVSLNSLEAVPLLAKERPQAAGAKCLGIYDQYSRAIQFLHPYLAIANAGQHHQTVQRIEESFAALMRELQAIMTGALVHEQLDSLNDKMRKVLEEVNLELQNLQRSVPTDQEEVVISSMLSYELARLKQLLCLSSQDLGDVADYLRRQSLVNSLEARELRELSDLNVEQQQAGNLPLSPVLVEHYLAHGSASGSVTTLADTVFLCGTIAKYTALSYQEAREHSKLTARMFFQYYFAFFKEDAHFARILELKLNLLVHQALQAFSAIVNLTPAPAEFERIAYITEYVQCVLKFDAEKFDAKKSDSEKFDAAGFHCMFTEKMSANRQILAGCATCDAFIQELGKAPNWERYKRIYETRIRQEWPKLSAEEQRSSASNYLLYVLSVVQVVPEVNYQDVFRRFADNYKEAIAVLAGNLYLENDFSEVELKMVGEEIARRLLLLGVDLTVTSKVDFHLVRLFSCDKTFIERVKCALYATRQYRRNLGDASQNIKKMDSSEGQQLFRAFMASYDIAAQVCEQYQQQQRQRFGWSDADVTGWQFTLGLEEMVSIMLNHVNLQFDLQRAFDPTCDQKFVVGAVRRLILRDTLCFAEAHAAAEAVEGLKRSQKAEFKNFKETDPAVLAANELLKKHQRDVEALRVALIDLARNNEVLTRSLGDDIAKAEHQATTRFFADDAVHAKSLKDADEATQKFVSQQRLAMDASIALQQEASERAKKNLVIFSQVYSKVAEFVERSTQVPHHFHPEEITVIVQTISASLLLCRGDQERSTLEDHLPILVPGFVQCITNLMTSQNSPLIRLPAEAGVLSLKEHMQKIVSQEVAGCFDLLNLREVPTDDYKGQDMIAKLGEDSLARALGQILADLGVNTGNSSLMPDNNPGQRQKVSAIMQEILVTRRPAIVTELCNLAIRMLATVHENSSSQSGAQVNVVHVRRTLELGLSEFLTIKLQEILVESMQRACVNLMRIVWDELWRAYTDFKPEALAAENEVMLWLGNYSGLLEGALCEDPVVINPQDIEQYKQHFSLILRLTNQLLEDFRHRQTFILLESVYTGNSFAFLQAAYLAMRKGFQESSSSTPESRLEPLIELTRELMRVANESISVTQNNFKAQVGQVVRAEQSVNDSFTGSAEGSCQHFLDSVQQRLGSAPFGLLNRVLEALRSIGTLAQARYDSLQSELLTQFLDDAAQKVEASSALCFFEKGQRYLRKRFGLREFAAVVAETCNRKTALVNETQGRPVEFASLGSQYEMPSEPVSTTLAGPDRGSAANSATLQPAHPLLPLSGGTPKDLLSPAASSRLRTGSHRSVGDTTSMVSVFERVAMPTPSESLLLSPGEAVNGYPAGMFSKSRPTASVASSRSGSPPLRFSADPGRALTPLRTPGSAALSPASVGRDYVHVEHVTREQLESLSPARFSLSRAAATPASPRTKQIIENEMAECGAKLHGTLKKEDQAKITARRAALQAELDALRAQQDPSRYQKPK